MGLLNTEMRKLGTFSNTIGMNTIHRMIAGIPPRNGDNVSARRTPPITSVHTANDHLAFAKPTANALIAINHTSNVI